MSCPSPHPVCRAGLSGRRAASAADAALGPALTGRSDRESTTAGCAKVTPLIPKIRHGCPASYFHIPPNRRVRARVAWARHPAAPSRTVAVAADPTLSPAPGSTRRAGPSSIPLGWLRKNHATRPHSVKLSFPHSHPSNRCVAGAPLSGLVLPPRQAVAVAAAACPTLRSLAPGPVGEVNLDPGVPDGLVRRVPHRAGEPLGPCSNGITSSTPPRRSRASSPGAYRVPFSPASPPVPSGPCVSVGSVGFPEHVGVRGAASRTRMPMGIRRTCQLGEPSDTPPTALHTRVGRFAHLPLWR